MSRIQLGMVKSCRVSLCEQPPPPPQKGLEKCVLSFQFQFQFEASAGRLCGQFYTQPACSGWKLQTHLSNPFWGPIKKFFFGGCSQRLTLQDFTIGSCIRDKVSPYRAVHRNTHDRISVLGDIPRLQKHFCNFGKLCHNIRQSDCPSNQVSQICLQTYRYCRHLTGDQVSCKY